MTLLDEEIVVAPVHPEVQTNEHREKLVETAYIVQNWLEQDLIQPEIRPLALDFIHAVHATDRA